MGIKFFAKVSGTPQLRTKISAVKRAMALIYGKGFIEKILLTRTRGRFFPKGATSTAQQEPSGRYWTPPSSKTIKRKKYKSNATADATRALYSSGALFSSIAIIRRNTSPSAVQSTVGGFFTLGVRKSSPAFKYARLMHSGGITPRGGWVPRRNFIGIGKGDTKIISDFMHSELRKGVRS